MAEEATQPAAPTQDTKDDQPPKKIISLKHIKSTEPAKEPERKRVFLPEVDSKQDFPITVAQQLNVEKLREALEHEWKYEPVNSPARMKAAGWCDPQLVDKLWIQKSRMDSLFDDGEGFIYRQVRDTICPLDTKGSQVYWNRAGDKLQEVYDCIPFFGDLQTPVEFFDVCGGPGAWSQFLLERLPKGSKGFGITIRTKDTPKSDVWYNELLNDKRFTPLYGKDKTGDVYNPENIDDVVSQARDISMVVADGGFKIEKDPKTGEHLENLQELYSARIILSEILIGVRTLVKGGSFVCKLFDCFSEITVSMLFLVCTLFQDVHIVKPPHSRRVNSERYLVANGFLEEKREKLEEKTDNSEEKEDKADTAQKDGKESVQEKLEVAIKLLEKIHKTGFTEETSLTSLFASDWLKNDNDFVKSISAMCTELCERQTEALEVVMDEVDVRRSSKGGAGKRKYDDRDRDNKERDRGGYWNDNRRGNNNRQRDRDIDRRRDDRDTDRRRDDRDRNADRRDRDRDRDRGRNDRDRYDNRDNRNKRDRDYRHDRDRNIDRDQNRDTDRNRDRRDRDRDDKNRDRDTDRNRDERDKEGENDRERKIARLTTEDNMSNETK